MKNYSVDQINIFIINIWTNSTELDFGASRREFRRHIVASQRNNNSWTRVSISR
jgi:hypothetical protein